MASQDNLLIGLWFDGQTFYADTLQQLERKGEQVIGQGKELLQGECQECKERMLECPGEQRMLQGERWLFQGEAASDTYCPTLAQTRRWLDIYFRGQVPDFTPPLQLIGTPFRQAVWQLLLQIPYGQTTTYGALAKTLAEQKTLSIATSTADQRSSMSQNKHSGMSQNKRSGMSAQAVGGAVGHNPIGLIIPCHRVIGTNGALTGYAAGLDRKQWLLQHEKALTAPILFL